MAVPSSTVRVFLRPIGSPLTVGLSGLAIASLVQSGLDLRWVAVSQTRQVGVILLLAPFVLQLLACIFSYLARDGAAGAAMGVLATTWGALGVLHLTSPPGARSGAEGLLLLSASALLALTSMAVFSAKPIPGVVFLLAATRFALVGIYQLGGTSGWRDVGGIVGLVILGLASYAVLAFELEEQQLRPVVPTLRRGRARLPPGPEQLYQDADVAREAGIRPTT